MTSDGATKTVLFFGFFDRAYARTKVLRHGFERNGWRVEECHVDPKYNHGISKYAKLFLRGLGTLRRKHDLVLVGFPGHNAVWAARLLFGKNIVFDAFLSNYDANLDRKIYTANSWRAKKDKWLDTWSCKLARKVILDTEGLKEYFVSEFGIARDKLIPVPISADDELFVPHEGEEETRFVVHFHGTFIPLQGVPHIIEAAQILRDKGIRFRIVGGGQEAGRIDARIAELKLGSVIERVQKVPVQEIPDYMAKAHVVLGIFGDGERALRAIPNKVYEAMAMGKAVITEDSPGIRELPGAKEALMLVRPGSGEAIAKAIMDLKENEALRNELGKNARKLFEERLLPEKLVSELLVALNA